MILYPSLVIRTHLQLHPQTNIKKYYGTIYSSHFQAAQIISTDPAHGIDGIYKRDIWHLYCHTHARTL